MIGFRHHRGSIQDAMETYRTFKSMDEFREYILDYMHKHFPMVNTFGKFYIELYNCCSSFELINLAPDVRIGWTNTFIVGFEDWSPIGWLTILDD